MSGDFHNRNYTRRSSGRESGKVILIITEGSKTEPHYFVALIKTHSIRNVDIPVVETTDPVGLVSEAKKLRDSRKEEAERTNFRLPYDEVWVVFDREEIHGTRRKQASQAKILANGNGIFLAASDPCFEYWLLLHEIYTTRFFNNAKEVIGAFKKHVPTYSKKWSPSGEFLENIHRAYRHAEKARAHHETAGGDGNPSTDVDLLCKSLLSTSQVRRS